MNQKLFKYIYTYRRQITTTTLSALVVLIIASIIQILRYEYHYQGQMRIDRLTGGHQYYCNLDNNWKASINDCIPVEKIHIINGKTLPSKKEISEPESKKHSPAKCLSDSEYVEKSKREGFDCEFNNAEGSHSCGHDKDSSGKIEPWEMNWSTFIKTCIFNQAKSQP